MTWSGTPGLGPLTFDDDLRLIDGSASSPSLTFANDQQTGFWRSASGEMTFASVGLDRIVLLDGQIRILDNADPGDFRFQRFNGTDASKTAVSATDVLGQVGGSGWGSHGAFSAYMAAIWFMAEETPSGTTAAGSVIVATTPTGTIDLVQRWKFRSDGHLHPVADATYDIGGETGPNRVRTIYASGSLRIGSNPPGQGQVRLTQDISLLEMADPAAPGSNEVRFYARDNGTGKTQIVAKFNTGAVQVIATEP